MILKCPLMIVTVLVILVLTLFVWLCMGLIYISGLVLGLLSTVIALLGVAVLITYSPQNGAILLVMAFLISPMGLSLAAGHGAEFEICDPGLDAWINVSCSQSWSLTKLF